MRLPISFYLCIVCMIIAGLTPASAVTYTVHPDGSGDYPTIQDAIDAVSAVGDTVYLGSGTFQGVGNRDIDFQGKPITVASQSDDPASCIIDCQGSAAEEHRAFIFSNGEDWRSKIRGIKIINGYDPDPEGDPVHGGAIGCMNGSSPTIEHCVFENNTAHYRGGAIYCHTGSSPTITNCEFIGNVGVGYGDGGAVGGEDHCHPTIEFCLFENNSAGFGGAISLFYARPCSLTVAHSTFVQNTSTLSAGGALVCGLEGVLTLTNCTFSNNTSSSIAGAVYSYGCETTISGCRFIDNSASSGGAISHCLRSEPASVTGCDFIRNTATSHGAAVDLWDHTAAVFEGCTFYGNSSPGNVLYGRYGCSLTLERTIISHSTTAEAIHCPSCDVLDLSCCNIYENEGGDWVGEIYGLDGVDGNISLDPRYCNPASDTLAIHETSPCAAANHPTCDLIGSTDVLCYVNQHDVCPTGGGDFTTIQDAIDAAADYDEVLLCLGVYQGPGNRDMNYDGKRITIRPDGGALAIIDCESAGRAFLFYSGEDSLSVLQGVMITNGSAGSGGAISCQSNSSPKIVSCSFLDCAATNNGGAIRSTNDSAPIIRACLFEGNTAGQYGGAYEASTSSPVIENCAFTGNTAVDNGGAISLTTSTASIEECLFAENEAGEDGGAICLLYDAAPTITGATLWGNACGGTGGGIYVGWDSDPVIGNTIVAASSAGEGIYCSSSALGITLTCSDIFGNAGGDYIGCLAGLDGIDGNFSLDPLFCSAASANYYLSEDSPCLPGNPPSEVCGLIGRYGAGCPAAGVEDQPPAAQLVFGLRAVRPNPTRGAGRICFAIPSEPAGEPVALRIFDATGRLVRTLQDGPLEAGEYELTWDGRDRAGAPTGTGLYFAELRWNGQVRRGRLIRLP